MGTPRGGGGGEGKRMGWRTTHGIASGIFLLSRDDGAGPLGLVQCSFASDNSFSLRRPTAGLAADFRDGIPIV